MLSLLVVIDLLVVGLAVATAAFLHTFPPGSAGHELAGPATVAAAVVGGVAAVTALGLRSRRPYGRVLQRWLSLPWLAVVPFGTLAGLVTLIYLGRPAVRLLFSGREASTWASQEVEAAARSRRVAPAVALVLGLLYGLAFLVLAGLAATLIPALSHPIEERAPQAMVTRPHADFARLPGH